MSDVFENKYIKSIKDIEEKMSLGVDLWHFYPLSIRKPLKIKRRFFTDIF